MSATPGSSRIVIAPVPVSSDEAQSLIRELDAELLDRYPQNAIHGLHPGDAEDSHTVFLVARVGNRPVACGAVRRLEPGISEVKRMYVRPGFRRRGIARELLWALESAARAEGATVVRLESGARQPEALTLYRSAGYVEIDAFGEYAGNPFSVCLEKALPRLRLV